MRFIFALALTLLTVIGTIAVERKPNVVVFLADDAGWGDYSHNGNKQIATTNIDSIAQQGVTMDRFYVCPVCSPTRAEFLTGRYHMRGGVHGVSTGQERLNVDEKTLADALKAAGYATGAFGKWHNGSQWPYHPMARGFNEYFGHSAGHWGEYFDAPLERNGKMISTTGYIVDVCTNEALRFIDEKKDVPFFCYIPFTTPHSPWAAPAENWAQYKDMPITQGATDAKQERAEETRCALAMVKNQDWNVGRVLNKLADLKIVDNTIVLYFSDNGPNSSRYTGGMKGKKGSTDEGGIRSPLFIRWPAQLPAGHTVTQISAAIDLLPTLLSLTKVPRVGDKPLDGRDLSPLLKKESVVWDDRMLFSTWAGKFTVRTQQYRLDAAGKLFDMVNDPGQTTSVNEQQPELTNKLSTAAKAWFEEVSANIPKKVKGTTVDQRSLDVGYPEFPITMLPARDGEPMGKVKRSSNAPNCSYFVNWTATDDSMVWLINVITSGRYQVDMDYTCADPGSTIELSFHDARLQTTVTTLWNPPLNTNQDTIPRPNGESQMKPFKSLDVGVITLQKGAGALTLRALKIPGKSVMDVRRMTLTLLPK